MQGSIYVVIALIGAIFWGLADIATKILMAKGIKQETIILFNSFMSIPFVFLYIIIKNSITHSHSNIATLLYYLRNINSCSILLLLLINAALIFLGLMMFYTAIKLGKVAIASAIMSTKVLWTLVFSIILINEKLTIIDVIGILFIILGIFLIKF